MTGILNIPGAGLDISQDIISVAAGGFNTLALSSNGAVWAWGDNAFGQVGNGTTVDQDSPTSVFSDAVAIAAGARHSLALKSDGTVWAWGDNSSGQLGNGTDPLNPVNSSVPVPVSALDNVVAIAAGSSQSLALKSDGTVWGWGYCGSGMLGVGCAGGASGSMFNLPQRLMIDNSGLLISGAIGISAGANHTLILLQDTDADGLEDTLEASQGTDPNN